MWFLGSESWVLGSIFYVGLLLKMDLCMGNDELFVSTNGTSGWPSSVSSMYILGDSSVDCGDNTPFYPILHQNLSLNPCNGSDQTLLPQLLGTYSLSLSLFLCCCLSLSIWCMYCYFSVILFGICVAMVMRNSRNV